MISEKVFLFKYIITIIINILYLLSSYLENINKVF
jgi:hypothetical protein